MRNFGLLCFCLALGLYAGREFINWFWWYYYNDDEDEENPAPLLCMTWTAWEWIGKVHFWLWMRLCRPIQSHLASIRRRFSPLELPDEPADKDGRTPTEWLLIGVIGIWNLEWYKGDYDQNIKKKWDEYMKNHNAIENSEAKEVQTGRGE